MLDMSKLDKAVESNRRFFVDTLCKLISIPTVVPPGEHYSELTETLEKLLIELGFDVKVYEVPRNIVEKCYPEYADYPRYIVVARIGSQRPTIHINGHYDVVPPGSGWSRDPFRPTVEDGKVYGRGATDMKGGIATAITFAKSLVESHQTIPFTLELSFTPDEEIGGLTGVKYMLESRIVNPDYAIVAEPSGIDNVWYGNKGSVWLLVEVFGKQAHGSTPWLGVNAFEKMVELVYKMIHELKPRIESKISRYEYEDPRGARATINIGGEIRGGAKINIVPGYVAFTIDRRVIPEESAEEALNEILSFIEEAKKAIPDLNVNVKVLGISDAVVTDPEQPIVKAFVESIREVVGRARRTVCIGGLDTRYFQKMGIPAVTYGPGEPSVAHLADEYIPIDHYEVVAKVYGRAINRLLRSHGA